MIYYIYFFIYDQYSLAVDLSARYTKFEEAINFPQMTVPQFFLHSLKNYVNPIAASHSAKSELCYICFLAVF